jgi:hypothetical protein
VHQQVDLRRGKILHVVDEEVGRADVPALVRRRRKHIEGGRKEAGAVERVTLGQAISVRGVDLRQNLCVGGEGGIGEGDVPVLVDRRIQQARSPNVSPHGPGRMGVRCEAQMLQTVGYEVLLCSRIVEGKRLSPESGKLVS